MSKVLFIQESPLFENLGLYYLSAILQSRGHTTDVIFYSHERNVVDYIRERRFNVVGFSVFSGGHHFVRGMCKQIKESLPDVHTVVGGPHITEFPLHMIQHPHVDFEFFGEINYQILDFLEQVESATKDWSKVPNLTFKDAGKPISNARSEVVMDLDSLPYPHRELYYKYPFLRKMDLKRFLTGRGCPFRCSFCSIPLIMTKQEQAKTMRRHSVDRVIGELVYAKDRFPMKSVHFHDDLFTVNKTWIQEFAEQYPKHVGIPFICNARFDTSPEVFKLLKQAGCGGVQLGLESADEHMRNKLLSKSLSQQRIYDTTAQLKQLGIRYLTTSIINLPGETAEQAINTLKLNLEISPNRIRIGQLIPIPSLPIVHYAKKEGYLDPNFSVDQINDSNKTYLNTPYEQEFLLLTQYAPLVEVFPWMQNWIISLIRRKKSVGLLMRIGALAGFYREFKWFRFSFVSAFRFFMNTIRFGKGTKFGSWISNAKEFHQDEALPTPQDSQGAVGISA